MSIYPPPFSDPFVGDPERPWGSARPEWLAARGGSVPVQDDEAAAAGAAGEKEPR